MDMGVTIFLTILILFIIGFVIFFVLVYNGLIRLSNNIDKAWANIDVLLKQRSDEILNLVNVVKGYMVHEKETLESLTKARSCIINENNLSRKAAIDNHITNLLRNVFVVAEKYPDLKAGKNFLELQKRITGLENELADRREFYNDCVTIYNTRIQSIPDLFVAGILKLYPFQLFQASYDDKKYVEINF